MTILPPDIARTDLEEALASIGLSWNTLCQSSGEIALFGSRAAGLAHERSDWDLLCVGRGRTRRTRRIDLLWVPLEEIETPEWLGSELAGHIACYGRWLVGEPAWVSHVAPGTAAQSQKSRWILRRLGVWERNWAHCSGRLRQRYARLLRRDLQRHELLMTGNPVPPSPVLDRAWRQLAEPHGTMQDLARLASLDTAFVAREICPLAAH